MTNTRAAVKRFWSAIRVLEQLGVRFSTGNWIVRDAETGVVTQVCACGAVLAALGIPKNLDTHEDGENVIRAVARKLGISLREAMSLNNGFEGIGRDQHHAHGAFELPEMKHGSDTTWYNVGRALRRKAGR